MPFKKYFQSILMILCTAFFISNAYSKQGFNYDERFVALQNFKEEMNILTVKAAIKGVQQAGDVGALDTYYAESYIDHHPQADNGLDFITARYISQRPEGATYEIGSILAEGDYVAVHARETGFAEAPEIIVSIFKVNGGKIIEHWGISQTEVPADKTVSGNSMFPIEYNLAPSTDELAAKNFVVSGLNRAFGLVDFDIINELWTEDYIQHNPGIDNGRGAIQGLVTSIAEGNLKYELGFAMAYGDFVLLQTRYTFFGQPSVAVDIFRVENGQIAEHWDVLQVEVPAAETAAGNVIFPVY